MTRKPLLLILVAVSLSGLATAASPETSPAACAAGDVELGRNTRITLSRVGGRLAMTSLRDWQGIEWAVTPTGAVAMWRLSLHGPGSEAVELASSDVDVADTRVEGEALRLTWRRPFKGAEARVEVDAQPDSSGELWRWRLRAVLPDGWKVVRADWPILPGLRATGGLRMVAPFGWGLEYEVKPGMAYEGTYPSLVTSMPFVAFYGQGRGLYVGYHDAKAHHKHLAVKARQEGVQVALTHWPADADTAAGRYDPDFEVVVGAFRGDYWNAAQIYRAFCEGTVWGSPRGRLRLTSPDRPVPAWLKDVELWLMPDPEPLKNVEPCKRAAEFFGVPIALHWYNWHEIPFDTLYPEYFPPKPHFREGVKALQDAGFHVMPYINGRLCDPKSNTWTREGGEKAAARNEKGEPYTEIYGSKVPLNVMCPATKQWQEKIAGVVDRLVSEYGVDGVYIDQINAAAAQRCFSTEHGHSPGGGTFWFEGYRAMLEQIRSKLPKDRILTTEENAECWNDEFDALLMVNTPSRPGRRIVPLMPSVCGGNLVTFGFQYTSAADVAKSLPIRAKMARAFLWGAQLGWISVGAIMDEKGRREAEFLRDLAQVRRGAHEFLLTGRFLGEAEVVGDNPRLTQEGAPDGKDAIDLPAVMATAWLSTQGTLGLAIVNLSDESRAVEIRPPWDRLVEVRGGGSVPQRPAGPDAVAVTIPARGARVLRLSPSTRPS